MVRTLNKLTWHCFPLSRTLKERRVIRWACTLGLPTQFPCPFLWEAPTVCKNLLVTPSRNVVINTIRDAALLLCIYHMHCLGAFRGGKKQFTNWTKIEFHLKSSINNTNSRLQITTTKTGVVWLDQVSVMPLDTYMVISSLCFLLSTFWWDFLLLWSTYKRPMYFFTEEREENEILTFPDHFMYVFTHAVFHLLAIIFLS